MYTKKDFYKNYSVVYDVSKDNTVNEQFEKYIEETGINKSKAEIERLSQTLVGIKRSTGQHAGGIMIVPDYKDIHDFSPIQRPANDKFSEVTTTHYDYNAISGTILKLDIS